MEIWPQPNCAASSTFSTGGMPKTLSSSMPNRVMDSPLTVSYRQAVPVVHALPHHMAGTREVVAMGPCDSLRARLAQPWPAIIAARKFFDLGLNERIRIRRVPAQCLPNFLMRRNDYTTITHTIGKKRSHL